MKVILSRKGFDSSNGGNASPIMPDGTLLSLPIKAKYETTYFSQLKYQNKSLYDIIKELNPRTKIKDYYKCHLDPDIRDFGIVKGWEPLFGQEGTSQSHLENRDVAEGDLFLFFGWFKQSEWVNGKLHFVKKAKDKHIIWGYLQIKEIYTSFDNLPVSCHYHPHAFIKRFQKQKNCIYTATKRLSINKKKTGYGTFRYHPSLVLTKEGYSRTKWELPPFFQDVEISYHKADSFNEHYFVSASRGQEFVISEDSRVTAWAKSIIEAGTTR